MQLDKVIKFRNKLITNRHIDTIQKIVHKNPTISRTELSRRVCIAWNWRQANGKIRDQVCRTFLLELEAKDLITLPAKKREAPKVDRSKKPVIKIALKEDRCEGRLGEFQPITLKQVRRTKDELLFNSLIEQYHYLGYTRPIGEHLKYIAYSNDTPLACLSWSSAPWYIGVRDRYIGWSAEIRQKNLHLMIVNTRYLILPWVKIPHLASHLLALSRRIVPKDWEKIYMHPIYYMETFVDTEKFSGVCYKADNWQYIGLTTGRGKLSRTKKATLSKKAVWGYPLRKDFRMLLTDTKKRGGYNKGNTHFIDMWKSSIDTMKQIIEEFDRQWRKRKRRIGTELLLIFIFKLVLSKNKQGYAITLMDMWEEFSEKEVTSIPLNVVAQSSICVARQKLTEDVFVFLNKQLIKEWVPSQKKLFWNKHRIFGIDGTRVNLPRDLINAGYITQNKKTYYPQGLVSCLYELQSGISYDFELVSHKNERHCAINHLHALDSGDIVVFDRGYFSFSMLRKYNDNNIFTLFRLQAGTANKAVLDFWKGSTVDAQILYKPSNAVVSDTKKIDPHLNFDPITVRLIKYTVDDQMYVLLTTLIDKDKYPLEIFSNLYHARWSTEESYKISKILIDVEDFHSKTERGIKQEIYAHFVLKNIARMLEQKSSDIRSGPHKRQNSSSKKLSQPPVFTNCGNPSVKINFKNCLRVLNKYLLEVLFFPTTKFFKNAFNSLLKSLSSVYQKVRPNRHYPRISRRTLRKWQPQST